MYIKKIAIKLILLIVLASITLSGCGKNKKSDLGKKTNITKKNYEYFDKVQLNNNEELIYSIFKQKIGIYDVKKMTWNEMYGDNVFTYRQSGEDKIFTIGDSLENKFSIVERDGEKTYKSILDIDENNSIMPIGEYGGKNFFIYNLNDIGDEEERQIVYLDEGKLNIFLNLKNELITKGIILDNYIYYTIYNQDEDIYCLYRSNLDSKDNKKIDEIETDDIYRYNNKIVYVNGTEVKELNGKVICNINENSDVEILDKYGVLVGAYVDEQGELKGEVVDLSQGEKIANVDKFYGYKCVEGKILLYCENNIKEVSIAK